MNNMIPPEMIEPMKMFGGFLLIVLGFSYAIKFYQASFYGKVAYWSGLEAFGIWNFFSWIFIPITNFLTPLLVHGQAKETNLIKIKTAGWIHLFWGPVFFLLSLMFVVAGADFMGLPGTRFMNFVLTCGNPAVPPAITYSPPFTYKFPILKKARKQLIKILTVNIPVDKSKTLNAWEKRGDVDVSQYSGGKLDDDDDEEEMQEQEAARQRALMEAERLRGVPAPRKR